MHLIFSIFSPLIFKNKFLLLKDYVHILLSYFGPASRYNFLFFLRAFKFSFIKFMLLVTILNINVIKNKYFRHEFLSLQKKGAF